MPSKNPGENPVLYAILFDETMIVTVVNEYIQVKAACNCMSVSGCHGILG